MRLFIAINFDDAVIEKLVEVQSFLRSCASRGNFTLRENLHLTLAFIGEVPGSAVSVIRSAMDDVRAEPFALTLGGLGCFPRNGGDIWWVGMDQSAALLDVRGQLTDALTEAGVAFDKRKFSPHLTVAREVVLRGGFDASRELPEITARVGRISLMKSERVNGRLTYTEIYANALQGE